MKQTNFLEKFNLAKLTQESISALLKFELLIKKIFLIRKLKNHMVRFITVKKEIT